MEDALEFITLQCKKYNMKNTKINYLLYIVILLSFSCSKDNNKSVDNNNDIKFSADEIRCLQLMAKDNKISLEGAKGRALSYINSHDTDKTRSLGRNVKSVEFVTSAKETTTKSNTNSLLDTIMYVVNFSSNTGYVLLSPDNRTSDVFGYSTGGNFDMNNLNIGQEIILDGIKLMYNDQIKESNRLLDSLSNKVLLKLDKLDIDHTNTKSSSRNGLTAIVSEWKEEGTNVPLLLKTGWNQIDPYNRECPKIDGKPTYAGCGAIALGQLLAFHKKTPDGFDWSKVEKDYFSTHSTEDTYEMARFIRRIGNEIDTEFGVDKSSTTNRSITKYLKRNNYLYDFMTYYDLDKIRYSINTRRPVIIRGDRIDPETNKEVGHIWLLDGFTFRSRITTLYYYGTVISRTKETDEFINNNLGHGNSIGYTLPGVFNYPLNTDFWVRVKHLRS